MAADPRYFIPQQLRIRQPEIHRRTTAEEIWRDTAGKPISWCRGSAPGYDHRRREVLKARKPSFRCVAVEPDASAVLSGGSPVRTQCRASARLHP
jgi:cysteine synthase A